MAGIQKWALIVYLVLCVFLLSRPSPEKINQRANALDARLSAADKEFLAPALASALQMPQDSLSAFLQDSDSKPSSLIFRKLLQDCGSQNCEDNPAESLLKAGMHEDDAVEFFDKIEERIVARIQAEELAKTNASSKPLVVQGNPSQIHGRAGVRSTPD
jgi:hypothetical protein